MSVFWKSKLSDLKKAKGHPYFLDHSRDDRTCPFRFAEEARDTLRKHGASVKMVTYKGGHGWHGDAFGRIRGGIEWLEKNREKR